VDMVITLHACDIATDFALFHAIENNVQHIFSVPCCQHEVCSSIKKGGDFDLLLSHGLIKERFSALLTDSIRAEILKECGYEVDIIEFVDFAHSPKNLMLRCKLKKSRKPQLEAVKTLTEKYGFTQKLFELIAKEK
ncbi:MAG: methyltransferase, partial [Clostridia bacterium]|nr:methyltransferase [Clostridia bacterium]